MILRKIISNNKYIRDHTLYFRKLLSLHINSYNQILSISSYNSIFNYFNDHNLLSIKDFRVISKPCINCFESLTTDKVLDTYLLINFNLINHSGQVIILRKKIKLFTIPLITLNCSYIINDIERTVINQLKRRSDTSLIINNNIYTLRINPLIGPCLVFIINSNHSIYIELSDIRLKLSSFLSLVNLSLNNLYGYLLTNINILYNGYSFLVKVNLSLYINNIINYDIYDNNNNLICTSGTYIKPNSILLNKDNYIYLENKYYHSLILSQSITLSTITLKKNTRINFNKLNYLIGITKLTFSVYDYKNNYINNYLSLLLSESPYISYKERIKIYKLFNVNTLLNEVNTFTQLFNYNNYKLTQSNRLTLNKILGLKTKTLKLRPKDIYLIISFLIRSYICNIKPISTDNIDLKTLNRIDTYLFSIIKKQIFNLLKQLSKKTTLPHSIIKLSTNIYNNYITDHIREFYCLSPLSQILDQVNQLSELTHKRRITTLYHINTDKSIVNINLRSIDISYYSKICPIETPEGKSIGLINSLSSFILVNKYGKIKSPYIKSIINTSKDKYIHYYDSILENKYTLIDNSLFNINHLNTYGRYIYKYHNKFIVSNYIKTNNHLIPLSSVQLFSIAPLMIPFMNHNDGNRVLMGSNMQRQAIPCLSTNIPYVSTGIEYIPSINLFNTKIINNTNVCLYHDSYHILFLTIIDTIYLVKVFKLRKYLITNQNTLINDKLSLKPFSLLPNRIILNDSNDTNNGLLSLGHNLLTAFIPWRGYNFEDSIIISDRIANSDKYCSIHLYKYKIILTSNPDGYDIINKDLYPNDIPNIKSINDEGIIMLGSYVNPNDILVCKVKVSSLFIKETTPSTPLKLFSNTKLRYSCNYYRVPLGTHGKVINIKILTSTSNKQINNGIYSYNNISLIIRSRVLLRLLLNHLHYSYRYIYKNIYYSNNSLTLLNKHHYLYYRTIVINNRLKLINKHRDIYQYNKYTIKAIIITIAVKNYLQIGDKMSGRHGNKGVISKILPVEDMPYLIDGTPCDLILNPISITSRMNIGQLFELKLGLLVFFILKRIEIYIHNNNYNKLITFLIKLDFNITISNFNYFINNYRRLITITSIPFEGACLKDINNLMKSIIPNKIKHYYKLCNNYETMTVIDGLTGNAFLNKVSIGYLYFIKLYHLASNKIHARSTGPYSLITQQPLKGRSNFGGQRLGEMEVWALEAYGSSFILFELLNLKSDIISARDSLYNSLLFGTDISTIGISESLKVLIKEIMSFGLNLKLI